MARAGKTLPDFADKHIEQAIRSFLDKIDGQAGYRDKEFSVYHISNEYLANIQAEDITQGSLAAYFDTVNFRKGWDIANFYAVIMHLIKEGLPVDTRLFSLLNLEDYVSSASETKTKRAILDHDISKYYFAKGRGVSNSGMLFYIDAENGLRYTLIAYVNYPKRTGRVQVNKDGTVRDKLLWVPKPLVKHVREEIEKNHPFKLKYSPVYINEREHIRVPNHLYDHIKKEIDGWK